MTPEQRAREFVETGFRSLGVPSLEPYIEIIAELIQGAIADEREECAKIADDLAMRWRNAICRIGPKQAESIKAAADGVEAIALMIRSRE